MAIWRLVDCLRVVLDKSLVSSTTGRTMSELKDAGTRPEDRGVNRISYGRDNLVNYIATNWCRNGIHGWDQPVISYVCWPLQTC